MADAQIARLTQVLTASIAAGATASTPMDMRGQAGGLLFLGSTYVGGTASFKASTGRTGTYVPVYDNAGAVVALPAGASRAVHLPDAVMVGSWMKLIAATPQTTTAGAAPMTVVAKG